MPNCKNCDGPLTRGNIQVVRKPGKRTVRVHRRCTAGNVAQRPQEGTGGPLGGLFDLPIVVEGVLEYPEPPRYRFFVQPASIIKLKKALAKGDAWLYGFASNWSAGITIEIIPVLEEVAEMNPEAVAHFIEIEFKWKVE